MPDTLDTFTDVADQLGDYYRTRRSLQIQLAHADEDSRLRGIAITPRSGWLSDQPKSNAEQREAERDRIFAADETLQKIADIQSDLRDQLAALEGEIDALEERRDAMKWTVRQVLAETMSDRDIYFSERSVVEDAADHRTESQLFHEQEDPLNPDEELVVAKESVEDDIPF